MLDEYFIEECPEKEESQLTIITERKGGNGNGFMESDINKLRAIKESWNLSQ